MLKTPVFILSVIWMVSTKESEIGLQKVSFWALDWVVRPFDISPQTSSPQVAIFWFQCGSAYISMAPMRRMFFLTGLTGFSGCGRIESCSITPMLCNLLLMAWFPHFPPFVFSISRCVINRTKSYSSGKSRGARFFWPVQNSPVRFLPP